MFIKLVKGQFRSRILLLYQPSATLTALHFEKDININISLFDLEFTEAKRLTSSKATVKIKIMLINSNWQEVDQLLYTRGRHGV